MIHLKALPKESFQRARWKNGLGYTDQVAIHPETADLRRGDFLWRLSSARIEQSSDFSLFPEHDRVLVILKGEGLRLKHDFEGEGGYSECTDLPPMEPYEFPGDVPSRCELISGPITDLSVIIRKAEVAAVAETVSIGADEPFEWDPQGQWNFVFVVRGDVAMENPGNGQCVNAREGDALRVDLDAPLEGSNLSIRSRGEAQLVLVSLQSQ